VVLLDTDIEDFALVAARVGVNDKVEIFVAEQSFGVELESEIQLRGLKGLCIQPSGIPGDQAVSSLINKRGRLILSAKSGAHGG
jgi:hypothetical protein